MRDYEAMVILQPGIGDEEMPQALDRVTQIITGYGGQVSETNTEAPWGRRRLAYPIDDQTDGFYAVFEYQLDPARAIEVDRDLKLDDQVLRHLITTTDGQSGDGQPAQTETPEV